MGTTRYEAILSCSGGLDSTSLLLNLLRRQDNVHILNFDYGSKQNKHELKKLKMNLDYLRNKGFEIDYQTIDISNAMKDLSSSLTRPDIQTPEGEYNRENQKIIFVPNRNAIFASIMYAKAITLYRDTGNDVMICMGIHNNETSVYPDCTPDFFNDLMKAFAKGNYDGDHIWSYIPYGFDNKVDVLRDAVSNCNYLGIDLNIIMGNTLSCYSPNEKGEACGKCPTCRERLGIFEELGLKDPCKYIESQP
jgi:7-cyano-7-deazaguanine synthase